MSAKTVHTCSRIMRANAAFMLFCMAFIAISGSGLSLIAFVIPISITAGIVSVGYAMFEREGFEPVAYMLWHVLFACISCAGLYAVETAGPIVGSILALIGTLSVVHALEGLGAQASDRAPDPATQSA